jgi:DDE family transposase
VFCGRHLLPARQRRANVVGSDGAVAEVRALSRRSAGPGRARIILRAESGFCNDKLMHATIATRSLNAGVAARLTEANRVDYAFGPARNSGLQAALVEQLAEAKDLCARLRKPAREFRDFHYHTLDSMSRIRRVSARPSTLDGPNSRFGVTPLKRTAASYSARALYEDRYCARGEAENRIGGQFDMFADRASSATMSANELRMWFSGMSYVLVATVRRVGLRHTQFADVAAQTIRLKLLKLGAQVCTSVHRIHSAVASGCPNKAEFALAHICLQRAFSFA